jgi:hypothetical protein
MCTMIVESTEITGSGKGGNGWFPIKEVNVSYDHPFHAPMEYAVNLDFTNESQGPSARVVVELSAKSAEELIETIKEALRRGKEAIAQ